MASFAFALPSIDPEAWNGFTINGERVAGFIEFPRFEVARNLDPKETPGGETFSLTDKGAKCTEVEVTFILYTADDFAQFTRIYQRYIDPRRKLEKRTVVTIVHPSLYFQGIRQLYFFACGGIQPNGNSGGRTSYRITAKGKEFNIKTVIGGDGSKKVKADLSAISKAAKWITPATADALEGLVAAPVAAVSSLLGIGAALQQPRVKTNKELQKAAAKGDRDSNFFLTLLDGKVPK